jgi:hypothetical protein
MIINKKKVRFFISIFFKKKGYMKILKYIGNPVNPSTQFFGMSSVERSGRGLRVDPERPFLLTLKKQGVGAVEGSILP